MLLIRLGSILILGLKSGFGKLGRRNAAIKQFWEGSHELWTNKQRCQGRVFILASYSLLCASLPVGNPLEGVVVGESALGNAEMGLRGPVQQIPFNAGGVPMSAPVPAPAPVLQQGQVYSTPFVANPNANYTQQTVQQRNAQLMNGGVGGLKSAPCSAGSTCATAVSPELLCGAASDVCPSAAGCASKIGFDVRLASVALLAVINLGVPVQAIALTGCKT